MRYHQKLAVENYVVDTMQMLCNTPNAEGADIEFDQSVDFGNGYIMDIQVCQGDDGYWTQGVLYRKSDDVYIEVTCTDVGESFEGEYCVQYGDNEYVGEIVRKNT